MVLAGIGGLGPQELLIILVIVIVLFGASRLAGIGGALGQSVREFRKATKDGEEERKQEETSAATRSTADTRPADSAPPQRPPDFSGR